MRLAVIGAGSSGLVSLKYALDYLPGWDVVCYEQGDSVTGAWGRMPADFLSTSTKYTTQFACFPRYDAVVDGDEFYRGSEFGNYLEAFAAHFGLKEHIRFQTPVRNVVAEGDRWRLGLEDGSDLVDALIVCTGLVNQPKSRSTRDGATLEGKTAVVIGGGESAVDLAYRLSRRNKVYLSLRSGIRVSPRYHPVRGVPSDFLRTRLMESIRPDLRNTLGLLFVKARIRYEEAFRSLTGARPDPHRSEHRERRKYWALKLTERAKDQLFKMFHNKSDDFLDAVAEGRITIVGEPAGGSRYWDFEGRKEMEVEADEVFRCTGYRSGLEALFQEAVRLPDFHLGCLHHQYHNLFTVGFARPIIGNIPSLSEIQARYVTGLLAGRFPRPTCDVDSEYAALAARYPKIDTSSIYPVEYVPYCDELARRMDCYPTLERVGSLKAWIKLHLLPASTLHYLTEHFDPARFEGQRVFAPPLAIILLALVKMFDLLRPQVVERRVRKMFAMRA